MTEQEKAEHLAWKREREIRTMRARAGQLQARVDLLRAKADELSVQRDQLERDIVAFERHEGLR